MTLGEKIKEIRLSLRMSQKAFADMMGFSQSAISAYELGARKPNWDTIVKLEELAKKNRIRIKFLHKD